MKKLAKLIAVSTKTISKKIGIIVPINLIQYFGYKEVEYIF